MNKSDAVMGYGSRGNDNGIEDREDIIRRLQDTVMSEESRRGLGDFGSQEMEAKFFQGFQCWLIHLRVQDND